MVFYFWPIAAINNVLILTAEIMSHTESYTQYYSIKSDNVKNN